MSNNFDFKTFITQTTKNKTKYTPLRVFSPGEALKKLRHLNKAASGRVGQAHFAVPIFPVPSLCCLTSMLC